MDAAYDKIAEQWKTVRTQFRPREEEFMDRLLEKADRSKPVLDLGCGSGKPMAAFLLQKGFRVVGVDRSEALLAQAKALGPNERWICADMVEVDFGESFGAVVCWDALFHLERRLHRPVLGKIQRWLVPGGRLLFSTGGSANPPFRDTMWDQEFFYDSHPPEETLRIITEIGFKVVFSEIHEKPDGGRGKGKMAVIAEKASDGEVVL